MVRADALTRRVARRIARDLWARPSDALPALDGIRAFACAAIVFFHCTLFSGVFAVPEPDLEARTLVFLGNGFWTGVDVFFVLSGFLIGRILIRDLIDDGEIHFARFYLRRSLRVFPAYYVVLSVALFVLAPLNIANYRNYLSFLGAESLEQVRSGAWTNYVYLSNYLDPPGPDPMSWGWSLCVEEHFYLLLPAVLALTFRIRSPAARAGLLVAYAALPVAARALAYRLGAVQGEDVYYTSHTRFDQLLVGVLIAYAYVVYREPFQRLAIRLAPLPAAIGLLCIAPVWTFGGLRGAGGFAIVWQFLVLAIGVGLVMVNLLFVQNGLTRFFAHRLWYPLARVSYGMYLVHPIVVVGCINFFQASAHPGQASSLLLFFAATLCLSFLIASVLFLVVERPLLDLGARLAARPRVPRA